MVMRGMPTAAGLSQVGTRETTISTKGLSAVRSLDDW